MSVSRTQQHVPGQPSDLSDDAARAATETGTDRVSTLQTVVALTLLVAFVISLILLARMRDDPHWDRLVYLLSGFEAIVFAAVGAFFGVTVQRGAVSAARREADTAHRHAAALAAELAQHRAALEQARQDATGGRALAAAALAPTAAADRGTDRLAELTRLALALFPHQRPTD